MQFKSIIGQKTVIKKLLTGIHENRVAHSQLFLGPEGCGSLALAIAFVQYINCSHRNETDSCGICPSCIKFQKFSHPDLHFYFPTTTNNSVKKDPKSQLFYNDWRGYLESCGAYPTQNGWYETLGVGNKQGTIYTRDASDISHEISLKPYEAEYKTFIIWLPERMHESASNKLLKTFEEPPAKTIFILVSERYELLLSTIRSRAQLIKVSKLTDDEIIEALYSRTEASEEIAKNIAMVANGNWNMALDIFENAEETQSNFILFRQWLRLCFRPGNYIELNKLNGELARIGRERQKRFLNYGLETIHSSILHNEGNSTKVKKSGEEFEFSQKFAPYINQDNQTEIYHLLNESIYHIERNAHGGILFSDLSFKMGDLLKKKKKQVY
jgi:DNA polymerase-3 subunit delta'